MYAATGSSARDLQAMSDEVKHLTERRAELEELELVSMLDQDPIDAELAALDERAAPLLTQADELRAEIVRQQEVIDAELTAAGSARAADGRPAARRAGRPLRDVAGPAQGHRGGPPHQEPLRRLPPRALLGRGGADPRPAGRARSPRASSAAASSCRSEAPSVPVLILVRHGESEANARGLLLGRTDAALTELGRAQVGAARALVRDPVVEVRTSPLSRARDTAELLALGPTP